MEEGKTVDFPKLVGEMKASFGGDIEVQFFFICLLHLANEYGLHLQKDQAGVLMVRKKV